MRHTLLTVGQKIRLNLLLTWLNLESIDEEVERLVGFVDQEVLQKPLKHLVDLMVFDILLNLLNVFKFLNFVHFN